MGQGGQLTPLLFGRKKLNMRYFCGLKKYMHILFRSDLYHKLALACVVRCLLLVSTSRGFDSCLLPPAPFYVCFFGVLELYLISLPATYSTARRLDPVLCCLQLTSASPCPLSLSLSNSEVSRRPPSDPPPLLLSSPPNS